jgi:uncharacterized membrane protein (DUF2068 family)
MAVFETGLFIPLEIYELVRHATVTKVSLVAINVTAVVYLLVLLIKKSSVKPPAPST